MNPTFHAKDLIAAGAALLLLLGLSAASVLLPPAPWKTALGLGIAAAKVAIIGICFMRLNRTSGLTRIFAAAGVFWLMLLAVLTGADYLTR
jgi:cytochrome c oxidase subunit 4